MSAAVDVQIFLLSRYGIKVSEEDVKDLFNDLAGSAIEDCIDIPEIVAILIIPYLRKIDALTGGEDFPTTRSFLRRNYASAFEREAFLKKKQLRNLRAFNVDIIDYVLKMIYEVIPGSDGSEPQPLTKDLLRRIFTGFGEEGLVKDEALLTEMITLAAGDEDGMILDAETFLRGMTSDITLYDLDKETRLSTHYEDVFGFVTSMEGGGSIGRNSALSLSSVVETEEERKKVKEVFTFPQIDYVADTFRDKIQSVFVWVAALSMVCSYVNFGGYFDIECSGDSVQFGCEIGRSVLVWLVLLVIMW